MVRTLLTGTETTVSVTPVVDRSRAALTTLQSPEARLQRLRQPRSSTYLQAVAGLDAGVHVHDRKALDALKAAIEAELGELVDGEQLIGIVSRCYLGQPYEVHTLALDGLIIDHYKIGQPLPLTLERARALALHRSYACIEVYATRMVAVTGSGKTAIIEGA
ncbi:hypothetical protein [Stenotrophomonas sp. STM01]|uniref:hypothetical protein n=1 Tax=Stenotrophomonas sp. STM01 TaxID=2769278 RepID=UPI00177EBEB6|nr:hypothetical protein [Stenotrophomonas sp. STM01]